VHIEQQTKEPTMTTSAKQNKELQQQGRHEVSVELCLQGYRLSGFDIAEGIDFFASQPNTRALRAIHVETSSAKTNEFGSAVAFALSKSLIEEHTRFDLWFAFALELPGEEAFRFVLVPREEMQRFFAHKERLQPSEGNALRFQLFFDLNGEVYSCGHRFTAFVGLNHLFSSARLAA
jgi:hypothetical protein